MKSVLNHLPELLPLNIIHFNFLNYSNIVYAYYFIVYIGKPN